MYLGGDHILKAYLYNPPNQIFLQEKLYVFRLEALQFPCFDVLLQGCVYGAGAGHLETPFGLALAVTAVLFPSGKDMIQACEVGFRLPTTLGIIVELAQRAHEVENGEDTIDSVPIPTIISN